MTSLLIEHFDMPASTRDLRAFGTAGERAGDALAGRTVWCAMALPAARRDAEALRAWMQGAGPGVAAAPLPVPADEQLRGLAARLDAMLAGAAPSVAPLGPVDRELYAEGAADGEALVGGGVRPDDVVVAHDALSALVAQAVRERGARAVWHLRIAGPAHAATARQALDFLGRFTNGLDAYILSWQEPGLHGELVERVAAAMPASDLVTAEEFPAHRPGDESRRLAWRMALAEAVRSGREERVGGTLRARPAVAVR